MSSITIGLDIGDRRSHYCVLDADATVRTTGTAATTRAALITLFTALPPARVVLEVGTHSPWISRLLQALGHEVLVANARRVRLITAATRKSDPVDAETLARLGRADPALLAPIRHRGETAQHDLAHIRARDALVRARTLLINHVRGAVKAAGERLPAGTSHTFARRAAGALPAPLQQALRGALRVIAELTAQITAAERALARRAAQQYPETARLQQVTGVGPLTALTYVLTLEEPTRFAHSRAVGAYLGLCPRRAQSGSHDPQLRITKAGDPHLRRLLVAAAHYILGPFGPDCTLRRFGERIAARGGKNARKRAIVAVARKLAVLLHRLWLSGMMYQPLRAAA
jgi:transposase